MFKLIVNSLVKIMYIMLLISSTLTIAEEHKPETKESSSERENQDPKQIHTDQTNANTETAQNTGTSSELTQKENPTNNIESNAVEKKTIDIPETEIDLGIKITQMIHDQIDNYGLEDTRLSTVIDLELTHFGDIKNLQIDTSSGNNWFDKRVLAAVNRAAPFFAVPIYGTDYRKVSQLKIQINSGK